MYVKETYKHIYIYIHIFNLRVFIIYKRHVHICKFLIPQNLHTCMCLLSICIYVSFTYMYVSYIYAGMGWLRSYIHIYKRHIHICKF